MQKCVEVLQSLSREQPAFLRVNEKVNLPDLTRFQFILQSNEDKE